MFTACLFILYTQEKLLKVQVWRGYPSYLNTVFYFFHRLCNVPLGKCEARSCTALCVTIDIFSAIYQICDLLSSINLPDSTAHSQTCSHMTRLCSECCILDIQGRPGLRKDKMWYHSSLDSLFCSQSVMTVWQPSVPSLSPYLYFHNLTNRAALWSCRPLWSGRHAMVAVSGERGLELWCALWSHARL